MSCCPHGIHWDNACGGCVPPRCDKVEKTPYIPPGLVLNPRVELAKPSPGPWTFEPSESDSSLYKLMDGSGRVIGFLRRGTGGRAEWREFEANAEVIAAAGGMGAAGCKLVPVTPTQRMLDAMAALDGWSPEDPDRPAMQRWRDYWDAALNAEDTLY